jgi:hypothetical protein
VLPARSGVGRGHLQTDTPSNRSASAQSLDIHPHQDDPPDDAAREASRTGHFLVSRTDAHRRALCTSPARARPQIGARQLCARRAPARFGGRSRGSLGICAAPQSRRDWHCACNGALRVCTRHLSRWQPHGQAARLCLRHVLRTVGFDAAPGQHRGRLHARAAPVSDRRAARRARTGSAGGVASTIVARVLFLWPSIC